jgi:hypothetical protein
MTRPRLSPGSADALLFDLGRVVLDIDFPGRSPAGGVMLLARRKNWSGGFRAANSTTGTSGARSAIPNILPASAPRWG